MAQVVVEHRLIAEPLADNQFEEFGVVLRAQEDGTPCTDEERALDLDEGVPRLYIMRLHDKPAVFTRITRHLHTTQSLMSVGGVNALWYLAVAPPGDTDPASVPRVEEIRVFAIPGDVMVTLKKGTWHSGPYFGTSTMEFVNLELTDTNISDHHTYHLDEALGLRVIIEDPS
ncbi:MAG: ureidoglycolate lyase [Gordonia sp. (in: high G+C Gram-positive bacteria)]